MPKKKSRPSSAPPDPPTTAIYDGVSLRDAYYKKVLDVSRIIRIKVAKHVATIPSYAFQSCTSAVSIILPPNLDIIGEYAFIDCLALESINLPLTLTHIHKCAFSNCQSLKSVHIPPSVELIGAFAFSGCEALAVFECEGIASITIAQNAFSGCKALALMAMNRGMFDQTGHAVHPVHHAVHLYITLHLYITRYNVATLPRMYVLLAVQRVTATLAALDDAAASAFVHGMTGFLKAFMEATMLKGGAFLPRRVLEFL